MALSFTEGINGLAFMNKLMESEKSDIELMDKIRQGDMTAFGLLYARYADLTPIGH